MKLKSLFVWLRQDGKLEVYLSEDGTNTASVRSTAAIAFADKQRAKVRFTYDLNVVKFFTSTDKGETWTQLGNDISFVINGIAVSNARLQIGTVVGLYARNTAIHSVQLYDSVTPSSSSLRFNCDFTATNIRHGDTKFKCATGQVVTINQSGNDPATVIKKPVLRFDGADDFIGGLFNQTVTGGYLFAVVQCAW